MNIPVGEVFLEDDFHDYACKMCEDSGCVDCDPDNHDWHALKWIADGCESLSEVVERAEAQARYLRERLDAGWMLSQPVDTGYVNMVLPHEKRSSDDNGSKVSTTTIL